MYIGLKHDLMSLLYTSGDIDNRTSKITKTMLEKMEKIEDEIKDTYNVQRNRVELKEEIFEKNLRFSEMVPEIIGKNTLVKPVVIIEDFEEISDEMLRVPLAELKLYAHLYMNLKKIETIDLLIVFQHIDYIDTIEKKFTFELKEINEFFYESVEKYLKWNELTSKWTKERNNSIKPLKFPFKQYRDGQEKLARSTYITIAQEKKMFAQAPTGVGKTISTIFPAIKAVGENKIDKIFYLTAKTIGAKVAEESFEKMRTQGMKFRNITLTAKDKVCFKPNAKCNPVSCEYAKNYYGKVNDVIFEMLENENTFTRQMIEEYARKYKVCPFELSLDLSLYSDAIICDYNYVFDPNVYLKRYFEDGMKCNCAFLIDEAHNLVDRARNMYSAEFSKKTLITALEVCQAKFPAIEKLILNVLEEVTTYEDRCMNGEFSSKKMPHKLANSISSLSDSLTALFHKSKNKNVEDFDKLGELNTACNQFVNIAEMYDEYYMFYLENKEDTVFKLFCIDPSNNLKKAYKRGKSAIIFSATLSPLTYFRDILGGDKESYGMVLDSPFDVKNREILVVDNISTRYKDREKSYDQIVEQIHSVVEGKMGNYMVFLPSFDYMNKLKERFNIKYPEIKTIKQETSMTELEREVYLSNFETKPKKTLVSFNVISGIFSEGIDFKGDMLVGAIIVGVGLPMICLERNVIKDHFQAKNGYGFDFSYTFPGLNRVVQAAGRVIRTDNDRGIIMLIDDRFGTHKYKSLFPKEWSNHYSVKNAETTKNIVDRFWK